MSEIGKVFEVTSAYLTADRIFFLLWIYNAAVQALPDPHPDAGRFYVFVFRFAHAIAANINVVRRPALVKRGAS